MGAQLVGVEGERCVESARTAEKSAAEWLVWKATSSDDAAVGGFSPSVAGSGVPR